MFRKISFVMVGVLLATRLVLAGDTPQTVELPTPTGEYAVGRIVYEWKDDSREEIYSEDAADKRELVVSVWYPAAPEPDAAPAPYLPGLLNEVIKQSFGLDTDLIHDHTYADAAISGAQTAYPVLVFQPGNATILFTYAALLEEVASHGYIVVGINQTYNASLTVFADGRMVQANPDAMQTDDAQLDVWTADLRFVVDQLETLNSSDPIVAGKLDLTRLGFFGHSFGGAAAVSFCQDDSRCLGGIDLDGALRGGNFNVAKPFMLFFSQHPDCEQIAAEDPSHSLEECETFIGEQNANWDAVYNSATPGYRITLAGSVHNSFTDNAFLIPLMPELAASINGATIEPERAIRVTGDYVVAFFDQYIKGETAALLTEATASYPEILFESKAA